MKTQRQQPVCEAPNDSLPCPDCGCTDTFWTDDGELVCPACPLGEHRLVMLVTLGERDD